MGVDEWAPEQAPRMPRGWATWELGTGQLFPPGAPEAEGTLEPAHLPCPFIT